MERPPVLDKHGSTSLKQEDKKSHDDDCDDAEAEDEDDTEAEDGDDANADDRDEDDRD